MPDLQGKKKASLTSIFKVPKAHSHLFTTVTQRIFSFSNEHPQAIKKKDGNRRLGKPQRWPMGMMAQWIHACEDYSFVSEGNQKGRHNYCATL